MLDQTIECVHKIRNGFVGNVGRAGMDDYPPSSEPAPATSTNDSADAVQLYFCNLALIASNELKVTHRVSMALLEIIGQILRGYPNEVQEDVRAKLARLKMTLEETPF